jgi:hypothetical protein
MLQASHWLLGRGPAAAASPASSALPRTPGGWPEILHLGMSDGLGSAAGVRATADFGFRYQYLAGGVNTGNGWIGWSPSGGFVAEYVRESIQHGLIPVFSYYMLVQSAPGNSEPEARGVYTNLQNAATMTAYYQDLRRFFQAAGAFPDTLIVLHVEPDLWGFMQQRARADDARTVMVPVAATGVPELVGLSDDLAGFAAAARVLRDRYAPNVHLAYHVSVWGTGNDIVHTNPPDATVDALAARAAAFYRSLQTPFDLTFAEFSDRDAAFKEHVYGDRGRSWWDAEDFRRNTRFLREFVRSAALRVVMWQIPYGNTRMRSMNNTRNHYQDNRVEWLLDDPGRGHLAEYLEAGVIAFLFGRGADGATCACDGAADGITNPEPINGNDRWATRADDDGGFFREQASRYYSEGALSLPAAGPLP